MNTPPMSQSRCLHHAGSVMRWVARNAKEHLIDDRATGKCRCCVYASRKEDSYFEKGRWCSVNLRNQPTDCRAWQSQNEKLTDGGHKTL